MVNFDITKLDIMVVDDSSTMRAILKMILSKLGVKRLRMFHDAAEAYEAFRKGAKRHRDHRLGDDEDVRHRVGRTLA